MTKKPFKQYLEEALDENYSEESLLNSGGLSWTDPSLKKDAIAFKSAKDKLPDKFKSVSSFYNQIQEIANENNFSIKFAIDYREMDKLKNGKDGDSAFDNVDIQHHAKQSDADKQIDGTLLKAKLHFTATNVGTKEKPVEVISNFTG